MDAKEARTNSTLSSSVSDGSTKYAHNSPTIQASRIQSYHDIGSNSLGKMDATTTRPCAIIGPDRVLPSNSGEVYLKKTGEPWPCQENIYRHTTDYPNKLSEYQPNRNISPRQTFQENMQRIMVPPTYSSIKIPDESSSKNTKLNMPQEAKYCDVPYSNPVSHELKSVRNSDIPMTNMNPAFGRSVPPYGWSSGVNVRPLRPYGAPEFYQYPEYPSCAGPRPMQMVRQHQTLNGDATQVYPDHLYQEANIRFKPYPLAKERNQQIRYDYISNYPNTFHPPAPFPPHRYDLQKSIHGHPYPIYPQIPVKYLDRRIHEPITDSYQRSPNVPNINMAYRNQTVPPTFGPLSGNCLQTKQYSDGTSKPSSKLPYDSNNKVYLDLEPKHSKSYPIPDNLYLNEMNHPQSMRGDVLLPAHPTLNMHSMPQHAIYRKDNAYPKNFEYNIQCRNFDQSMNNSLPRFPLQYSPNTLAISPSDSNTSNDTAHTLGTSQDDCGYVSQSSTTSVRSLDSYNIQATNDALRRHNYHSYGFHKNNVIGKDITPRRKSSSSDKKNINVRQFLQMWNEGDDDANESNKDAAPTNNPAKNNEEQLYVLGSMTVPSNEIGKYEHIQKISKLPENIKGFNSLELLNQYEELLEPCNTNKYANKPLISKHSSTLSKNTINKEHIVPVSRPVSPLDVEAKISQSVIHKEVGCNFEIKPCSPEMLNVEIATPVQNILGERTIEKVINPVITHTPILQHGDEIKIQNLPIKNASCKMISHPFIPDPSADKLKANNYSVQDLETNSGVCLASLPQLDNDIELNFPEINQQFINANIKGSNIQMPSKEAALLDADQNSNFLNEKSKYQPIHLLSPQMPFNSGTEREVSKLSKYRKNRRIDQRMPSPKDFSQSIISSVATQRIDSVIIKNPDNIKLQELQDTNYVINTLLEDNNVSLNNNTLSLEKAIDFSLNKIEDDVPIDDSILIKHSENHTIEDQCDGLTEYNNLSTDVKEDDLKTLKLTQENGVADPTDHITTSDNMNDGVKREESEFTLKLAHNKDREHYEFIRTPEKIPDVVEMQQDEFPLKLLQNNVNESCDHTSKSGNTSEDIEMKKDSLNVAQVNVEVHEYLTTSDNVTEASEHERRNSVEGRYSACENISESVEIIQEKLANAPQNTNLLNKGSTKDICNVNTNISYEHSNNALLINSQAMSVIHVGEAISKVTALSDMQTSNFATNNVLKGNDVSVIRKNEQLSEISADTILEDTNHCTGISLPMLENIPDTQVNAISDKKPKSIDNRTVNINNEINAMDNDNICSGFKEESNSNIIQKDDVDSISAIKNFIDKTGNSTVTNVLKTVDDLDITLNIHSVLHILTNGSGSDKIPNSYSITKSEESKDENTGNVQNEESVVNEFNCSTDNMQITNTISGTTTYSDNLAEINISESLELLQTSPHANENNYKEGIVTDKLMDFKSESNHLFSFCHELPSSDDLLNTNTNSVISEVMHKTTVQSTDLKNISEYSDARSPSHENYTDNVIHNDVDTLSTSSPTQKAHKIETNSKELQISGLANQNTDIIKEVENNIIIKNVDTDVKNKVSKQKYGTELTNNRPCQKNTKILKELFSPWIQKLMTHNEGIYKSHNTSNKEVDETMKDIKEYELPTVEVKQVISIDNKENMNEDTDKVVLEKICTQQNISDTKDTLLLVLPTDNSNVNFVPCNKVNECDSIMHTSASEGTILKFEADLDREISVDTKLDERSKFLLNQPLRVLKRSLSESALQNIDSDSNVLYPSKRRKENDILQSNITAEDICKIVQNNRRNSVSTFYNDENVYILIDNDLIISEESVDSQKICYADTDEGIQQESEPVFDKISESFSDSPLRVSVEIDNYNNSTTNDEKSTEESWVEDVACMETVFSDDVAEDITIDETMSPKISNEEDFETENDDSFIYQEMCESEHINKLRYIYGNSVSNENVQLFETLYHTPQMDVNKTLDIESHNIRTDKFENDDFKSNHSNLVDDKENLSDDLILKTTDLNGYDSVDQNNFNNSFSNDKSISECLIHSCETRKDNFTSNSQKDNSHYSYSSSPEVSSTTSEEKSILLKITSYNGSRSSQINEISADDITKISYKLTENKEYRSYKSNFSSTKTLITKAAQKYIPPLIETIGDLKVKLPLPQHRLNKLKQLKKTKIEPKISQNIIRYKNKNPQSEIPKKPKPKFEDVLKSIDEVQFKKRKDKLKKIKAEIPKVVIKKSEDGAHYTSALNKNEVYNPDLTGRKWQPWVFLDKNVFIDRMAIKKKYKAIYCHRKKTYVLAEKFRKYKSVYNAKFVITQPRSDNPENGNLKYTIRLQHK